MEEHQTKNLDLLSAWASEVVRNWACWALKRGTVAVGLEAQRRFEELHRRHLEVDLQVLVMSWQLELLGHPMEVLHSTSSLQLPLVQELLLALSEWGQLQRWRELHRLAQTSAALQASDLEAPVPHNSKIVWVQQPLVESPSARSSALEAGSGAFEASAESAAASATALGAASVAAFVAGQQRQQTLAWKSLHLDWCQTGQRSVVRIA